MSFFSRFFKTTKKATKHKEKRILPKSSPFFPDFMTLPLKEINWKIKKTLVENSLCRQ